MKLFYFIAGIVAGTTAYLIWKQKIRTHNIDPNDLDGDPHTFNINELVAENSVSLQELKERLE